MAELQARISEDTKVAMKARDKARVATLRMVNSEIKRIEVDERRELSDEDVLGILNRMLKQRRDSLNQFEQAERMDLAEQERFEIAVIESFMPESLSEQELDALIARVVQEVGATSMKDMGQVMGLIKSEVTGRADMGLVSSKVKACLS
jgi:uncharacterized protein YqeY